MVIIVVLDQVILPAAEAEDNVSVAVTEVVVAEPED